MANPRVVSFLYSLKDPGGNLIDSTDDGEPFSYMEGVGQMIPGLESQMTALNKGDKKTLHVPFAQAYGERDETLVLEVPRDKFPVKELKIGDQFQVGNTPGGPPMTVADFNETTVTLDGNHPLAGVDLTFQVEVVETREATDQELAHGHAHGHHGHDH
ncbi:MAG: peptidylprolyl isomerase [Deltaproteobacteria bacterium]|nr:peptidylprolyl isomerase [Deltaproteobacteria bacterium]